MPLTTHEELHVSRAGKAEKLFLYHLILGKFKRDRAKFATGYVVQNHLKKFQPRNFEFPLKRQGLRYVSKKKGGAAGNVWRVIKVSVTYLKLIKT